LGSSCAGCGLVGGSASATYADAKWEATLAFSGCALEEIDVIISCKGDEICPTKVIAVPVQDGCDLTVSDVTCDCNSQEILFSISFNGCNGCIDGGWIDFKLS
jgi:hypothetical protein